VSNWQQFHLSCDSFNKAWFRVIFLTWQKFDVQNFMIVIVLTKRLTSTFNAIIYYSLLGYSHKRPLCNTRHTGKTTQTAVTPPETLVSCTPGRPRNRITHVSIPGSGTFLTWHRGNPNVHFSKSLHFREPR
jgi:hypothetical protein